MGDRGDGSQRTRKPGSGRTRRSRTGHESGKPAEHHIPRSGSPRRRRFGRERGRLRKKRSSDPSPDGWWGRNAAFRSRKPVARRSRTCQSGRSRNLGPLDLSAPARQFRYHPDAPQDSSHGVCPLDLSAVSRSRSRRRKSSRDVQPARHAGAADSPARYSTATAGDSAGSARFAAAYAGAGFTADLPAGRGHAGRPWDLAKEAPGLKVLRTSGEAPAGYSGEYSAGC